MVKILLSLSGEQNIAPPTCEAKKDNRGGHNYINNR